MKKYWFKLSPMGWVFIICSIIIFSTPFFFSQSWLTWIGSFDETTGVIGDTIGGITSPFVGLLVGWITYKAFREQYKANQIQADLLKLTFEQRYDDKIHRMIENKEKALNKIQIEGTSITGISAILNTLDNFLLVRKAVLKVVFNHDFGNPLRDKIESFIINYKESDVKDVLLNLSKKIPFLYSFFVRIQLGEEFISYSNKHKHPAYPDSNTFEGIVIRYLLEKNFYTTNAVNYFDMAKPEKLLEYSKRCIYLTEYYLSIKSICNEIDDISKVLHTIANKRHEYLLSLISQMSKEELAIVYLKFLHRNEKTVGITFLMLLLYTVQNSVLIPTEYHNLEMFVNNVPGSEQIRSDFSNYFPDEDEF
jgi:hypothetical protein